jgi:putative nucleotidyltransferase with HDIG domain
MPVFAWVMIAVTIVLTVCSLLTGKRLREPHPAVGPLKPAPWEREDGYDLTMPTGAVPAALPLAEGVRVRPPDRQAVAPAILDDVAHALQRIPPLPRALMQVVRELDDVASTAKSVATIVATEPVLTATLLRVANSASTGVRREIVTVADAVAYLGFSTVKALFLRLQLGSLFGSSSGGGAYDAEKLWSHSMAVAQVAEDLARRVGHADPQLALTLGLLHDIGKVAINSQFPAAVKQSWETGGAADESFLARERRLFGADHAFIGAYLATQWKLPDELATMIRLHHLPQGQSLPLAPASRRALYVVHVANQLVKYCHVYCEDMELDIVPPPLLRELGLVESLDQLLDERTRGIIMRSATLGQLPARAA